MYKNTHITWGLCRHRIIFSWSSSPGLRGSAGSHEYCASLGPPVTRRLHCPASSDCTEGMTREGCQEFPAWDTDKWQDPSLYTYCKNLLSFLWCSFFSSFSSSCLYLRTLLSLSFSLWRASSIISNLRCSSSSAESFLGYRKDLVNFHKLYIKAIRRITDLCNSCL